MNSTDRSPTLPVPALHTELIAFLDDVRGRYPDLQIGEPNKQGQVMLTWREWSITVDRGVWPEAPTFANIPNHWGTIYDAGDSHGSMLRAFVRQMTVGWSYYSKFETFPAGSLGYAALLQYWQHKRAEGLALAATADAEIAKMVLSEPTP